MVTRLVIGIDQGGGEGTLRKESKDMYDVWNLLVLEKATNQEVLEGKKVQVAVSQYRIHEKRIRRVEAKIYGRRLKQPGGLLCNGDYPSLRQRKY